MGFYADLLFETVCIHWNEPSFIAKWNTWWKDGSSIHPKVTVHEIRFFYNLYCWDRQLHLSYTNVAVSFCSSHTHYAKDFLGDVS